MKGEIHMKLLQTPPALPDRVVSYKRIYHISQRKKSSAFFVKIIFRKRRIFFLCMNKNNRTLIIFENDVYFLFDLDSTSISSLYKKNFNQSLSIGKTKDIDVPITQTMTDAEIGQT